MTVPDNNLHGFRQELDRMVTDYFGGHPRGASDNSEISSLLISGLSEAALLCGGVLVIPLLPEGDSVDHGNLYDSPPLIEIVHSEEWGTRFLRVELPERDVTLEAKPGEDRD